MPTIRYKIPKMKVESKCKTSGFTLANGLGSFAFLSDPPISKYSGVTMNYGLKVFRILENIKIKDAVYDTIEHNLDHVKRFSDDNQDTILMPEGINGLIYKVKNKAQLQIDIDVKKPYDNRVFGRYYDVKIEDDLIIVKFTKMSDGKEDSIHMAKEFEIFCVIKPLSCNLKKEYVFLDKWEEHHYSYDESRYDEPLDRHIYRPFMITAKGALISAGRTKEEALQELKKLKKYKRKKRSFKPLKNKRATKYSAAAFVMAQNSLHNLSVKHDGMTRLFAGYPWFFQFWTRDESISTGAMIKLGRLEEVKAILMQYLDRIAIDGRIPNRLPASSLGCADGVGWVFKRLRDLIGTAKETKKLEKLFTVDDIQKITKRLKISLARIERMYQQDGLIRNNPLETWMDTHWQHLDGREGFCIEIQCQYLNMLRFAHELTKDDKYRRKMERMALIVKHEFFNGKLLADRKDDFTQRPNIFIAYYHFPELLSRKGWETAFSTAISKLWLQFGGLSSIDTSHYLFTDHHTGTSDQSYHRGDTWYWINNLAALCLWRNNPIRFEREIAYITEASSKEILWMGSAGDHAEVGDAKELSSKGCLAQTWSSAFFIELMLEAYER